MERENFLYVFNYFKHSVLQKETTSGSSPFAAFSGFTVNRSSSNPFGFLNRNAVSSGDGNNSSSVTSESNTKNENGSSVATESKKTTEVTESGDTKKSMEACSKQKRMRNIEYYRHLQGLNESVMNWMQLHLSKNACCDFTPVFNDYKKHLDTLNLTYPVKEENEPAEKQEFFKQPSSEQSSAQKSNDGNLFHIYYKVIIKTRMPINFFLRLLARVV